ncbi:hypothetical protein CIB48_g10610 [Xylaria polymorpha]|nr:hypothetical protein CIB48_g10610 [Xylaria polymorpha]
MVPRTQVYACYKIVAHARQSGGTPKTRYELNRLRHALMLRATLNVVGIALREAFEPGQNVPKANALLDEVIALQGKDKLKADNEALTVLCNVGGRGEGVVCVTDKGQVPTPTSPLVQDLLKRLAKPNNLSVATTLLTVACKMENQRQLRSRAILSVAPRQYRPRNIINKTEDDATSHLAIACLLPDVLRGERQRDFYRKEKLKADNDALTAGVKPHYKVPRCARLGTDVDDSPIGVNKDKAVTVSRSQTWCGRPSICLHIVRRSNLSPYSYLQEEQEEQEKLELIAEEEDVMDEE